MGKRQREGILPFKVVQSDAPLIARGGLALPYEFARSLKLPKVIDEELPRPGSGRGYKASAFVMPMVLMLHGGGKKLEDLREVKGEKSLREVLEMDGLPASCTVGDWLRRMGESGEGLLGLGRVSRHVVTETMRRDGREGYTLDVDSSIIEAEKEEAQFTYKGERGYQPQMGFVFELGLILEDEFREGNVPAQAGAVGFLKKCFEAMPEGKYIEYVRVDSAYYQAEVMNLCFDEGKWFTITADKDRAVMEAIKSISDWRPYKGGREIGETVHTMSKTKEAFRLVVQRWPKLQGELFDASPYCYHAIATNREEEAEEIVRIHNKRGELENYIKELKSGFGMEWMPCGETYANAVFFRIGVIAYNLFQAMKLLALPPWYRSSTISTVRWKLYQIAAEVTRHAHQVLLKLAASLEKVLLFQRFRSRCRQLAYDSS
jgi:hypothetical protein